MLGASILQSFAGLTSKQALLIAIGLAGLTVLVASTRRRIRKSRPVNEEPKRNRQESSRDTAAVRDVEQVMIELDQLSQEVHARLDAKVVKLERLIRDADARIARLSSDVTVTSNRRLDVTLDAESPQRSWSTNADLTDEGNNSTPPRPEALSQHATLYRLADEGLSTAEISKKTGRLAGEVELILSLRKITTA